MFEEAIGAGWNFAESNARFDEWWSAMSDKTTPSNPRALNMFGTSLSGADGVDLNSGQKTYINRMYGYNATDVKNAKPIYGPVVPQDHKLAYESGRVTMVARTGHDMAVEEGKYVKQTKTANIVQNKPKTRSQMAKSKVNRTPSLKNRNTVKRFAAMKPRVISAFNIGKKSIADVFKGRKGRLLQVAAFAGTAMMGCKAIAYQTNTLYNAVNNPYSTDNRSAYLPGFYKTGYQDIKETLTDFGSRVNLDKTARRVIAKTPSSTRFGRVTNTNAVMNSNIALNLANNAINHTRY